MKIKSLLNPILILAVLVLASFTFIQTKPWPVPDKYVKMTNPTKGNTDALKDGKELWGKHCTSCHGKTGKGDGSKAAQLETEMRDLGSAEVQKQTDGELFYKIAEGRDEMPTFKKKIAEEEDIWMIVTYMRSIK